MAYLSSVLYDRVVKESTLLLEDEPNHVKSLARRGKAYEKLAGSRGTLATFSQRKEYHNLAMEDMKACIEILSTTTTATNNSGDTAAAAAKAEKRLKRECE